MVSADPGRLDYVHTFGPDILRGQQRLAELRVNADPSTADVQPRLEAWLADPANRVLVHPARSKVGARDGRPNWSGLCLLLGVSGGHQSNVFTGPRPGPRLRQNMILREMAAGRTTTGIIDDLVEVTRPDGTTGPWHPGLDPDAIHRERLVLRDACFVVTTSDSCHREVVATSGSSRKCQRWLAPVAGPTCHLAQVPT